MSTQNTEEFNIIVPAPKTVKQGTDLPVSIALNRGSQFKQDVKLDIKTDIFTVTPANVVVKSGDKSDAQFQIGVPKNTALGAHRITIKGTPTVGECASTELLVQVVAQ